MSRALLSAISRQEVSGLEHAHVVGALEGARRRHAVALARPMGMRLLAWCESHAELAARHGDLVDALRRAMADGERIAGLISEIYSEIPEAMECDA